MPRAVLELRDGAAVDRFHASTEAVLFKEGGEAFVECGVGGVAGDLAGVQLHGIGGAFERNQPSDIAVENAGVFWGANALRGGLAAIAVVAARPAGGPPGAFAERDAFGLGGQLFEQGVVGGELFFDLAVARVRFGDQKRDAGALERLGEGGEKGLSFLDHSLVVAVGGAGFDDLRVQGRAARGIGETLGEQGQQRGGAGAMEVGGGCPLLRRKLILRLLAVEQ